MNNDIDNSYTDRDQDLEEMLRYLSEERNLARGTQVELRNEANVLLDELDSFVELLRKPNFSDGYRFVDEHECSTAIEAALTLKHEEVGQNTESFDNPCGREIGNYLILDYLGRGGMSTVYRAMHKELGSVVAFKTLPYHRMNSQRAIARFQREMKAVGRLNHPNIVKALDAGEADGVHYIAMELVEGTDLSTLLKQAGTPALADSCEIVRQVASTLQYVHEQGLVHRDIKPSNLMLTPEGHIKILDLGLAQLVGGEFDELTKTGQIMGTLEYMAPEQSQDSRSVDIRADLYSLGVTFYKLLTGQTPYHDQRYSNPFNKIRAMLEEPIPDIRDLNPDVPQRLVDILSKMLARSPDDRFSEPIEVAEQLEPFSTDASLKELVNIGQKT